MSKSMRVFKDKDEVAALVKKGRKLLIFERKVIDVESFEHPGPQELISENLGEDITEAFLQQNHSANAERMMEDYQVGILEEQGLSRRREEAGEVKRQRGQRGLSKEREEELHRLLDTKIDPSKPLLDQVKYLSREEFLVYVSRPRSLESKEAEDGLQLYSDKRVDNAAKSNVYHNAYALGIVTLVFSFLGFRECRNPKDLFQGSLLFFLLMCHWSLMEYLAHRFMLHTEDRLPEKPSPEQIAHVFRYHVQHHVYMNQRYRIAQHPRFLVFYCVLTWTLLYLLGGWWVANTGLAGFSLGLNFYDILHYYFHHGGEPSLHFVKRLKANHMKHHWRDNSKGFGVTTLHWDSLFSSDHVF